MLGMPRLPRTSVASGAVGVTVMLLLLLAGCGDDSPTELPAETPTPPGTTSTGAPTAAPSQEPPVSEPSRPDQPTEPSAGTEPTTGAEPTVVPDVLTQDDDGRQVTLQVGDEVPLRLDSAWSWSEPRSDGDVVTLSPVDYLVDPGFVEWLVGATSTGTATLTATGEPACADTSVCPPTTVTLTVEVTG